MAVYHRHALEKAKYIGVTENGIEICEHVILHKQVKDQGFKIFINSALINVGFVIHTQYFSYSKKLNRVIWRTIRKMLITGLGKNNFSALRAYLLTRRKQMIRKTKAD